MPTADLSITMDDGMTAVAPGAGTSYTIIVSNNGPDAVTGASVVGSVPFDITADTWLATGSTGGGSVTGATSGNSILGTVVDLPVGATVTFTYTVLVSQQAAVSLSNSVMVIAPSGTTDPNSSNNFAQDSDTVIPQADLAVTLDDHTSLIVRQRAPSTHHHAAV